MFDTSLTIGDEILQQALGKGTNKHMQSIVATIQREQNEIIRHDEGRLLIVQGAGSGKTSGALRRIAYLLYKYREWLKADQIILFSLTLCSIATFLTYYLNSAKKICEVTFQEYLNHRLSKSFDVEDPYEQLEYMLTETNSPTYKTRNASIRFKASTQFFEMIRAYRQSLESSGMLFRGMKFRGKLIASAKEITEQFYNTDSSLRFNNRIEKLTDWLNKQIDALEKAELKKPWVEEEIELLSKDEYQKAYKYLQKKASLTTTPLMILRKKRKYSDV